MQFPCEAQGLRKQYDPHPWCVCVCVGGGCGGCGGCGGGVGVCVCVCVWGGGGGGGGGGGTKAPFIYFPVSDIIYFATFSAYQIRRHLSNMHVICCISPVFGDYKRLENNWKEEIGLVPAPWTSMFHKPPATPSIPEV